MVVIIGFVGIISILIFYISVFTGENKSAIISLLVAVIIFSLFYLTKKDTYITTHNIYSITEQAGFDRSGGARMCYVLDTSNGRYILNNNDVEYIRNNKMQLDVYRTEFIFGKSDHYEYIINK